MMKDFYNDTWYDERWRSLPPVMRKLAADTIKRTLADEDQELIRQKHAEFGHDWIHRLIDIDPEEAPLLYEAGMTTMSAHHGFGTSIRNLLRDEEFGAGIKDDDLPEAPYEDWPYEGVGPRNWDDYYVQAVEAAVGVRDV